MVRGMSLCDMFHSLPNECLIPFVSHDCTGMKKIWYCAGLNQHTCPAHSCKQNISTTTPLALPLLFLLIIIDQQLKMKPLSSKSALADSVGVTRGDNL